MSGRFAGKSVLVTGAARGIGRATAELFAAEGARLVVNDVDEERIRALASELADAGAEVLAVVADVADEAHVERLVDAATAAFGGLDVAVANAGIIPLHDDRRGDPRGLGAGDGHRRPRDVPHLQARDPGDDRGRRRVDRVPELDLRPRGPVAARRPTGRRSSSPPA